ncbi:MAG: hypothetical protein JWM71_1009 [Solirubrobacteraceae bacterium]|nr:hypothetical protein [Solirubrobacteraceae bacterium]
MLFDLRGTGRRTTVRIIYLGLAVLMGGGLVLFGVGGSVGGGLLNAVNNNGSTSTSNTFAARVKKLETTVKTHPKDANAWAQLAQARFQETNTSANYDQNSATFTASGKALLNSAADAWDHYLALNPKKPNLGIARVMVQVFSPGALNQAAKAVTAEELVVDNTKATSSDYKQLAALAYLAGQTRKGDLSTDKAVSLAPKSQRKTLRQQLVAYKAQAASQSATSTTATPTATP